MPGSLQLGKLSWTHPKLSLTAAVSQPIQETLETKLTRTASHASGGIAAEGGCTVPSLSLLQTAASWWAAAVHV